MHKFINPDAERKWNEILDKILLTASVETIVAIAAAQAEWGAIFEAGYISGKTDGFREANANLEEAMLRNGER